MGVVIKFHNSWQINFKLKKYFAASNFLNKHPSGESSVETDAVKMFKVLDTKTSNTMPLIITTNRLPCN